MTATVQAPRAVAVRFYHPELDALRFFAFLAVYICHAIPAASARVALIADIKDAGNFGVCLFFLLSAYLITELLRRELEEFGTIAIRAFYLRRILRIWPLYFGVIVSYAMGGIFFHALRMETGRMIAYFLLAGNWYIALHPWIQTPLRALWSISVEEQFYLVWPLLGKFGGMRAFMLAAIVLTPFSLMTVFIVAGAPYAWNTVWLNSFAQFLFFACGALLALALKGQLPGLRTWVRAALAIMGLLAWWVSASAIQIKRPGAHVAPAQFCIGYVLVACGCICLFLSVLGIEEHFVPPWMAYLGKISFGLYVFHETAFLLVDEVQKHALRRDAAWLLVLNKIVALGATVFLAWVSYRFYESPFLRLKQHYARVPSRSV
ncbi:MAG TPA: acyltransferase [Pseudacidobacterium sp.]|nr:acyltransferase [Pseudacidobacterium sp.]